MPRRSLVILDDYYENPDEVREYALRLKYTRSGRFPGLNSANDNINDELRAVATNLAAKVVVNGQSKDITFFRITRGSDSHQADIHVDGSRWAGVCYLNPAGESKHSEGGTAFFRHKVTGLTSWPSESEVEKLQGAGLLDPELRTSAELHRFFADEGRDRSKWVQIMYVPPLYNRAIFYDAMQFHSISDWASYGETPETARLTRLFFFEIAPS